MPMKFSDCAKNYSLGAKYRIGDESNIVNPHVDFAAGQRLVLAFR